MDESINMVNELRARKRAEAAQRAEDKATVSANRAKRRARFRRCAGEVASYATLGGAVLFAESLGLIAALIAYPIASVCFGAALVVFDRHFGRRRRG